MPNKLDQAEAYQPQLQIHCSKQTTKSCYTKILIAFFLLKCKNIIKATTSPKSPVASAKANPNSKLEIVFERLMGFSLHQIDNFQISIRYQHQHQLKQSQPVLRRSFAASSSMFPPFLIVSDVNLMRHLNKCMLKSQKRKLVKMLLKFLNQLTQQKK